MANLKEKYPVRELEQLTTSNLSFILFLTSKRLINAHKFWKPADFVCRSAKLSPTQSKRNLAFKWRYVTPAGRADDDDHPPSQRNCPYPRDSSCFWCLLGCLLHPVSFPSHAPSPAPAVCLPLRCFHVYYLVPLFIAISSIMFLLGDIAS
jgi:hypothetical protein